MLKEVYTFAENYKNGLKFEFIVDDAIVKNKDDFTHLETMIKNLDTKRIKKEGKVFMIRAYILSTMTAVLLILLIM